jgi:hypothetical protein
MVHIHRGIKGHLVIRRDEDEIDGGSIAKSHTRMVNNPSAPIPGLGSGTPRLAKQAAKPNSTSVILGGAVSYGLKNLSFSSKGKDKDKNVKLKA